MTGKGGMRLNRRSAGGVCGRLNRSTTDRRARPRERTTGGRTTRERTAGGRTTGGRTMGGRTVGERSPIRPRSECSIRIEFSEHQISSGSNQTKYAQGSAARHKPQSLRYSRMRFMIRMALVPRLIASHIHPIGHEPDLTRHVVRAEHVHPDKPRGIVDKMRAEKESLLDFGIHVVGHDKPA